MKKLSECTVLIVDDTELNINILVETLSDDYELAVATDGKSALEYMEQVVPDIVLLDIMMPEMSGFEVCSIMKQNKRLTDVPVIFLTAMTDIQSKSKGFDLGAVDYLTKPFEPQEVQLRVKTHLSLKLAQNELSRQNEILQIKVHEKTREIRLTQQVALEAIGSLAENKDPETGGHLKRTPRYIKILCQKLAEHPKYGDILNHRIIEEYCEASLLHDIGKIGIKDAVLMKPGKLTADEFEEMKQHSRIGYDALHRATAKLGQESFLKYAMEITLYHHEKWDGTGYPEGLQGKEIPLSSRLMAIADVYDALVNKRVYKPAISHSEAVEIISQGSGSHFDPELVSAFKEIHEEFRNIAIEFADLEEPSPRL